MAVIYFLGEIAARMGGLLSAILNVREQQISRLFRVLLGSAVLAVCNATVSGKGRRYRRSWEKLHYTKNELDLAFRSAVEVRFLI